MYECINAGKIDEIRAWSITGSKIVWSRSGAAVRKKITPGLFYAKSDHELQTKVKKNSPKFPMVIYTPSNGRRFRRYDFRTMIELLKTVFWTDGNVVRKIKSGAIRIRFFR
jgi:hypothetical protein